MPLYDIEHVTPLTSYQQEAIARSFIQAHGQRFQTPSIFINVRFIDASHQVAFRGGVLRKYNRAILRTRVAENRSDELYQRHCRQLVSIWEEVVEEGEEVDFRPVWVLGALTTALEARFATPKVARPKAGQEKQWLQEHKNGFRRLAEEGDEDMQGLMNELATK